MNIRVHIERLILDGLPLGARQRAEVHAAIIAELTKLLTADGLHSALLSGGALPSLRTEAIHLTKESDAPRLGTQIAQAVYSSIGTGTRGSLR